MNDRDQRPKGITTRPGRIVIGNEPKPSALDLAKALLLAQGDLPSPADGHNAMQVMVAELAYQANMNNEEFCRWAENEGRPQSPSFDLASAVLQTKTATPMPVAAHKAMQVMLHSLVAKYKVTSEELGFWAESVVAEAASPTPEALTQMERQAFEQARQGRHETLQLDSLGNATYNLCIVACHTNAVVLLSERRDNPGVSVTNAFEKLAANIHATRFRGWKPARITWLEHFPDAVGMGGETLDRVTMQYDSQAHVYYSPIRHHISLISHET